MVAFSNFILLFCVASFNDYLIGVTALFEDQLGEYDWQLKNIGAVKDSLHLVIVNYYCCDLFILMLAVCVGKEDCCLDRRCKFCC